MQLDRVSHMEVLARICERKGWALVLRAGYFDREERHAQWPSEIRHVTWTELLALDIVQPLHDRCTPTGETMTRSHAITAGELISRVELDAYPKPRVEHAAAAILAALVRAGLVNAETT